MEQPTSDLTQRHRTNLTKPASSSIRPASKHRVEYHPPSDGTLSLLPASLVPYGELARLHKPAGYFAFYFPHLIGFLLAKVALPYGSTSMGRDVTVHLCLLVGSFFLRSAACAWNDVIDAPYDRQVVRCQLRPIARNAISRSQGLLFTVFLTAVGAFVGLMPLSRYCLAPAALLTISQIFYPLCKRFTNYPQLWLGFSMSFGLGVGVCAADVDLSGILVKILEKGGPIISMDEQNFLYAFSSLYAATVLNIFIYDTIYGHQDLEDDIKAGVKSVAVAWRDMTKIRCAILAVLETALLAVVGSTIGLSIYFHIVAVGGTALILAVTLYQVQLDNAASCMHAFKSLIVSTGLALVIALWLSML